ncbi:hypothetical protein U9K47_15680 [Bacillus toyonensis]|uniref:hypothetical protein n=1 Tax=Bacillus toyonensis TaxID=155322 RepID=UPI0034661EDD
MSIKNNVTNKRNISNMISLETIKSTGKITADEQNMRSSVIWGKDLGSVKVKTTDGELLLLLDNFKFVFIDPGTSDCNDFVTWLFYVQTTGWKTAFPPRFQISLILYDKNHNPIWRVTSYITSRCKYNYDFAVEEELPFDTLNEVKYVSYDWEVVQWVRCN